MSQRPTKILAFPIFRKYWLYHSWTESAANAQSALKKDWRKGVNMEEKLSLLGQQLSSKVGLVCGKVALPITCGTFKSVLTQAVPTQATQSCIYQICMLIIIPWGSSIQVYEKLLAQWRDLQAAKQGSIKHWLYR